MNKRYTLCEQTSPWSDKFSHFDNLEEATKALNNSKYNAFITDNVKRKLIYKENNELPKAP